MPHTHTHTHVDASCRVYEQGMCADVCMFVGGRYIFVGGVCMFVGERMLISLWVMSHV